MVTPVAVVDRLLSECLPAPQIEHVNLEHGVGRVLMADVVADRDGPPFHRVAMDGYAVAADQNRSWKVTGLQVAGVPPMTRVSGAIEVATGAVLPAGCDTVIPYEATARSDDLVHLLPEVKATSPGSHVHKQGTDYRVGQVLIPQGTPLRSAHLHCLASVGKAQVAVRRRATWTQMATGDELVEVLQTPLPWQIRRSNASAIEGEARAWGLVPEGQVVLPDQKDLLARGLSQALGKVDALVLTGGVSAGVLDLVPQVLAELGTAMLFHRVAQRPGKPFWCGIHGSGTAQPTVVFALPGNPVSSLFSFRRYVLPWLLAFEGRTLGPSRISISAVEVPSQGQTVFLPWSSQRGLLSWKGSGDFSALGESTGFVELNADLATQGQPLYYPWGGLL